MSTYSQLIYHIVFATKNRDKVLDRNGRYELFDYIADMLDYYKCEMYQIGGVEDHIHIVTHIHPSLAIATLITEMKQATSEFIAKEGICQGFSGWQNGYGAFTYHNQQLQKLVTMVRNQEYYHQKFDFRTEYMYLLKEHRIKFNPKFIY